MTLYCCACSLDLVQPLHFIVEKQTQRGQGLSQSHPADHWLPGLENSPPESSLSSATTDWLCDYGLVCFLSGPRFPHLVNQEEVASHLSAVFQLYFPFGGGML